MAHLPIRDATMETAIHVDISRASYVSQVSLPSNLKPGYRLEAFAVKIRSEPTSI